MSNAKNIRNTFNQRMNEADMGSWREREMNVGVGRDEARADARIAKERDRVDDLYRQHYHHLNPHPSLHPDQKESPTGLNNINNHIQQKEKRLWAAHYAAMKHSGTDKTNFHQSPDYWKHLTDNTGMYSPSRFYDPDRVHKMVRHGIINPRIVPDEVKKKDAFKTIDREIAARDHANQVGQEHLQKNPNASNEELHHVRWNAYTQHYLSTEPYKSMMPKGIFDHTEVPKSQRIRDIFESRIKEDRTTTFTGVDKDSGSYNRVKWQPGPTKGTARLGKYGGTEKLVGGDGTKMSAGYFDKKTAQIASELDYPPAKPKGAQSTEYTAFKAERHKEASKAGEVAAGVKRGKHVTPGQTAQSVYGGTDLEGKPRVTPEQLSKEKLRMSLQHHVNRLRGSNPELAARYRNLGAKRGMQLASTDHYRAGLRALFETVLDEAKEDEAFGPVDPNDPKSFGEKPLKQPPKIKFKPKPANMPKGPIAVTKKPFQRDPLDP